MNDDQQNSYYLNQPKEKNSMTTQSLNGSQFHNYSHMMSIENSDQSQILPHKTPQSNHDRKVVVKEWMKLTNQEKTRKIHNDLEENGDGSKYNSQKF